MFFHLHVHDPYSNLFYVMDKGHNMCVLFVRLIVLICDLVLYLNVLF